MKIIKILVEHSKNMSETQIREFLYKNMPAEVVRGLEYDDPKTIERTLKLLNIKVTERDKTHLEHDPYLQMASAN